MLACSHASNLLVVCKPPISAVVPPWPQLFSHWRVVAFFLVWNVCCPMAGCMWLPHEQSVSVACPCTAVDRTFFMSCATASQCLQCYPTALKALPWQGTCRQYRAVAVRQAMGAAFFSGFCPACSLAGGSNAAIKTYCHSTRMTLHDSVLHRYYLVVLYAWHGGHVVAARVASNAIGSHRM